MIYNWERAYSKENRHAYHLEPLPGGISQDIHCQHRGLLPHRRLRSRQGAGRVHDTLRGGAVEQGRRRDPAPCGHGEPDIFAQQAPALVDAVEPHQHRVRERRVPPAGVLLEPRRERREARQGCLAHLYPHAHQHSPLPRRGGRRRDLCRGRVYHRMHGQAHRHLRHHRREKGQARP